MTCCHFRHDVGVTATHHTTANPRCGAIKGQRIQSVIAAFKAHKGQSYVSERTGGCRGGT